MAKKNAPAFDQAEYERLVKDLPQLPKLPQVPLGPDDGAYFNLWNMGPKKRGGKYTVSATLPDKPIK